MTIAIIEDNASVRELISGMIRRNFPELRFVGAASSVDEGIAMIERESPDILIVDIQLRDGTAFEVLGRLKPGQLDRTALIFVTAFGTFENLYQALRLSAIDYLVKPIDESHFQSAVRDAIQRKGQERTGEQVHYLRDILATTSVAETIRKVPVHLPKGVIDFVPREKVLYIRGEDNISILQMANGERVIAMRNLGYYRSSLLPGSHFFQVSKSLIINMEHLLRYDSHELKVHLVGDHVLTASRRGGKALSDHLKMI